MQVTVPARRRLQFDAFVGSLQQRRGVSTGTGSRISPKPEPATALSSMSQLTALCLGGDATLLSCLGAALPDLRALVRLRLRSMDIGTGPSATTTESSCEVERNLSVLTRLQLLEVSRSAQSSVLQLLRLHPAVSAVAVAVRQCAGGGWASACGLAPGTTVAAVAGQYRHQMGADVVASLQIAATRQGVLAFGVCNDDQRCQRLREPGERLETHVNITGAVDTQ